MVSTAKEEEKVTELSNHVDSTSPNEPTMILGYGELVEPQSETGDEGRRADTCKLILRRPNE